MPPWLVAHGVLLSCDLTYINHNGGIFDISQEEFDKYKEEDTGLRMFKYLNCNKPNSPNGFLAKYRYIAATWQSACILQRPGKVQVHYSGLAKYRYIIAT